METGARLEFKFAHQQRYWWKFHHAARFELWRLDSEGRRSNLVRTGPKVAYCLRDLTHTRPRLEGSPRRRVYPACSNSRRAQRVTLGTSIGWADIYPPAYPEQWIDVTGLRGCFAYVHIADPDNGIYESSEDNNEAQAIVRLPFPRRRAAQGLPRPRPRARVRPGPLLAAGKCAVLARRRGRCRSASQVHPERPRRLAHRAREQVGALPELLGLLAPHHRRAHERAAEPGQRLRRDPRAGAGLDDRQAGALVAPVERQRREDAARQVGRAHAVAGVAEGEVDRRAGQRPDLGDVAGGDVDRAAPGVRDPSAGERREHPVEVLAAGAGQRRGRAPRGRERGRRRRSARRPSRTGSARRGWCGSSARACGRR